MTRRVRNTKSLAKRMDLQYFTHMHPLRKWRRWLAIGIPVIAVVWFVSARATGEGKKVYSSGPVSAHHAFFGKRCELCHVTQGFFHKEVKDTACLSCHDAPAHHPTEVRADFKQPACGSCHVEHRASQQLAKTMDSGCTECHADINAAAKSDVADKVAKESTSSNGNSFDKLHVAGFDHDHPQFDPFQSGDPGTVKLNHYAHLHDKIAGPNGENDKVQMTCNDCHRTAADRRAWPYAHEVQACPAQPNAPAAAVQTAALTMQDDPREASPRAYMQPIKFATQCAGCHMKDLQFDKRFSDTVPHCQTGVVQKFLVEKYTQYIAAHPNAMSEPLVPNRVALSSLVVLPAPPKTREEWIKWQVANADRLLYDKGCKLCHTMVQGEGPIPTVAKSQIPVRWMQHADFDHDAHRMVKCESCHAQAANSRKTSDVLLPGVASCRGCHQQGGAMHDAADGRCSECHEYHDWRKEQAPKKEYSIPQLRSSAAGME
jgi:hypothetical protein